MVSFSVSEKLDTVHKGVRWMRGAQVYKYPSKLAIQLSVQCVQLNLIINILPVGVQLSPLACMLLLGTFSVSEKLDVVHNVYDRRGGLKYTCILQNYLYSYLYSMYS